MLYREMAIAATYFYDGDTSNVAARVGIGLRRIDERALAQPAKQIKLDLS